MAKKKASTGKKKANVQELNAEQASQVKGGAYEGYTPNPIISPRDPASGQFKVRTGFTVKKT